VLASATGWAAMMVVAGIIGAFALAGVVRGFSGATSGDLLTSLLGERQS
jgi:hypothetical protein